jgi:hypothetical protein
MQIAMHVREIGAENFVAHGVTLLKPGSGAFQSRR